jgi:NAD-dependent deacetylase
MADLEIHEHARRLISNADRIVVLTGAGISAESGVPTFRGDGGLWKSYRAEDLATPHAFARDPRLVWEWYGWRRELVAACKPNAAHLALAQFAIDRDGVSIITQNVDGLHAGAARHLSATPDQRAMPLELHGSLFVTRCSVCDWRRVDRDPIDATSLETLPRCERCGALARPAVVWFGESLDPEVLERAFDAASEASVCLVVGTSGVVQPAASIAVATHQHGGAIIEVNPTDTPLSPYAAVSIRDRASVAVPSLLPEQLV